MDKTIYQAQSCDAVSTTTREAQCDLKMFAPTIKQETVQCMDEEETPHNNCMYPCQPLRSSNCINYYDSQFCASEEVKKELPKDECSQSTLAPCINKCSIHSKIVIKNEDLSKFLETQELNQQNSEEAFSFIKTGEVRDNKNQFLVKPEMSEEHQIVDNVGVSGVLYDVRTTQEIQPKICGGILKKRLNLLTHSNEHLKVEPSTAVGFERNELGKCECCNEYFNNYNSNENLKSHNCEFCEDIFKRKSASVKYANNVHYDSGKIFDCWCGKQFRTPKHLSRHKYRQHGFKVENTNNAALETDLQCDFCKKKFQRKSNLRRHIRSIHYDYGKIFECWCGKQFPSPIHLSDHKYRQHGRKVEKRNNAALKKEFQCDICKKIFRSKEVLKIHLTSIHYDYGKTFDCWCGKQFRSPRHLYQHKSTQHRSNVESRKNTALKIEYQCDICKKMYKTKGNLKTHIISIHYDYGKTFECWCGKQFRTPAYLSDHKYRQHGPKVKKTIKPALKKEFQCDICKKFLKRKNDLRRHMTIIHYDYGRIFECWCGKQFRIPLYLKKHQRDQHNCMSYNKNKGKYKCEHCELLFKTRRNLACHVKKKHR